MIQGVLIVAFAALALTLISHQADAQQTCTGTCPVVVIGIDTTAEANAAERATGQTADLGTVNISRTATDISQALTVRFMTPGSGTQKTATNGTDYATLTGSAVILANKNFVKVNVAPLDDVLIEGDETMNITLYGTSQYNVGPVATAMITIHDNDPTVTISPTDATAKENSTTQTADGGKFMITRNAPAETTLAVSFSMAGTATNNTDYQLSSSRATIAAGDRSVNVTLTVKDDSGFEGTETARMTILAIPGYFLGFPDNATVNILENEAAPVVNVTVSDPDAKEVPSSGTQNPGKFRINRTGASTVDISVSYTLTGTATNRTDYDANPAARGTTTITGNVTIPSSATFAEVAINVKDDAVFEGDELVTLTLQPGALYTLGTPAMNNLTIKDDDPKPSVTVLATDATASESAGNTGTFQITRTGPTTLAMAVAYTLGGTASNGTDFTMSGGTALGALIAVGQRSANVTITAIDDIIFEGEESVNLTLSTSTSYEKGTASVATVKIQDNDAQPTVGVKLFGTAVEGANASIQFTRTGGSAAYDLLVRYSVAGTASNTTDYRALSGSATIRTSQRTANVTLTILDDTAFDPNETVVISVRTSPLYLVGTDGNLTVKIKDNDPQVSEGAFFATNVQATRLKNDTILVTWEPPPQVDKEQLAGYLVWRASSPFAIIKQVNSPRASEFYDTGAKGGTSYSYLVTAFYKQGQGLTGITAIENVPGYPAAGIPGVKTAERGFFADWWWLILVIALIVVAIIVAIALVARSRRTRASREPEPPLGPAPRSTLQEAPTAQRWEAEPPQEAPPPSNWETVTAEPEPTAAYEPPAPPMTAPARVIVLRCPKCSNKFETPDLGERPLYTKCTHCGTRGVVK